MGEITKKEFRPLSLIDHEAFINEKGFENTTENQRC